VKMLKWGFSAGQPNRRRRRKTQSRQEGITHTGRETGQYEGFDPGRCSIVIGSRHTMRDQGRGRGTLQRREDRGETQGDSQTLQYGEQFIGEGTARECILTLTSMGLVVNADSKVGDVCRVTDVLGLNPGVGMRVRRQYFFMRKQMMLTRNIATALLVVKVRVYGPPSRRCKKLVLKGGV
jgi:hypothetical protein